MNPSENNTIALKNLKKNWMQAGLFFILFIAGNYLFLSSSWERDYALRWLALASSFGFYQLWVLWRSLALNHREDEKSLLPNLGWANAVSFGRGIFIAALLGFLFSPWPEGGMAWLPFTFYLLAALSDLLDGYLARITNHTTELGAALDMSNDSWGVLIVTLLAFWYGRVPLVYLPVGLARYLFIFGLWLREKVGKVNFEMPFSYRRRIFAGVQMGFIVAMLAPVFPSFATRFAAILFMIPFLAGFLYDWLTVIGWIDPEKGSNLFEKIASFKLLPILLLGLRLAVVWLLLTFIFTATQRIFHEYSQFLSILWQILSVAAIPMLFLGAAGRLGAIFALISSGMAIGMTKTGYEYFLIIHLSTILLFVGTGAFSLWSPEEWLVYNRAGEKNNA